MNIFKKFWKSHFSCFEEWCKVENIDTKKDEETILWLYSKRNEGMFNSIIPLVVIITIIIFLILKL